MEKTAVRKKRKLKDWVKSGVLIVLVSSAIIGLRATDILTMNTVDGQSMLPNFHSGDLVFMSGIPELRRYDVVTATAKTGTEVIKRIIGLPGETIKYEGRHIYINGELADESFIAEGVEISSQSFSANKTGEITLGQNEYFIAGDNRDNSVDSRTYGGVNRSAIHGRVIAKW